MAEDKTGTTKILGARASTELNGFKFNVDLTIDSEFDEIKDTRNMLKIYVEKLKKSREPRRLMSEFDKEILKRKKMSKAYVAQGFKKMQDYAKILQNNVAMYIPMHQPHLLDSFRKKGNEFTLEKRIMHRYWESDSSEGISSKKLSEMPKEEKHKWHIDECLYIETEECTENKMVVSMDASFLFRKYISPIFLKQIKFSNYLLTDYMKDYAHEVEHATPERLPFITALIKKADKFNALPEDKRKRDQYVDDMAGLIVEEGIANYAVYTEDPFHLSSTTSGKFKNKMNYLLKVPNPDNYIENSLAKETYENDGAGVYYAGETACYFIAMLLERDIGERLINIEYKGKTIYRDDIAKALEDQRKNNTAEPIKFTSSYEQFLPTYKHIHGLDQKSFFEELYAAQEWLQLKEEDMILPRNFLDNLRSRAALIPAIPIKKNGNGMPKNNVDTTIQVYGPQLENSSKN